MRCLTVSLAAVTCGLIATTANAQWVNFSNQTSTRLLTPAPSNATVGANDVDEKDYAYADIDRDGDIDLVVVRKQPFTTTGRRRNVLFMNEGVKEGHAIDGVLVDRTSTLIPAFLDLTNDRDVVLVDVDGDGWLDIVTATTLSGDQPKSISHPRVYINRKNDVNGNWLGYVLGDVDRIPTFPFEPRFCAVSAGDIDGDGDMDLYFTDYDQGPYSRPGDVNDRLLMNDGNGYFTDSLQTRMTFEMLNSTFGMAGAIADMNGDGYLDIVKDTALVPPQRVSVSYNNPQNQGFFNQFQVVVPTAAPYHVSVGDLNNDGRLDMITSDDAADRFYLNQGNAPNGQVNWISFTYSFTGGGGSDDGFGGNNYIRDLNNDGWNDVLIADVDVDIAGCNRRMHIYRNLGNAPNVTLQEQTVSGQVVGGITPAMLQGTFDVAIFDINGDGWKDLVIGRCTGTQVWINVPPAGLTFSYPQGLPGANIEPTAPYTFTVQLATIGGGSVAPGSGQMRLSVNNGPFNPVALTSLGGNLYQATLPAGSCTDKYAFYFSGQLQGGGVFNDPPTAPAASYVTVLANGTETTVDQSFEGKVAGWSVVNDPSLTGGGWVRVDPNGTINAGQLAAPEDDAGGGDHVMCFVTENGAPGGAAGLSDVDFGPTYLTSPTIDLAGTDGMVTYTRWFYCSGQGTSQGDFLHTEVSNNNGSTWVPVHQVAGTNSTWEVASFLVSDFVAPTGQVRVRFWTSDPLNNSVTEAGIDNFRVEALICGKVPCPADISGDGSVGPADLGILLGAWGNNPGSPADLNGDGSVGPADLGILLGSWGPC